MMKVPNITTLSQSQRRRVRLGKRRGKYNREKRRPFTRDELIDYLRKNGFRSSCQLERGRKPGEPRTMEYIKEFGNWETAKLTAFGYPVIKTPNDCDYMCKAVFQFDLWTARKYWAFRKAYPDLVPSYYAVIRQYRVFSNLTHNARQFSLKKTLDDYLKLRRRLGRFPTLDECRSAGVTIDTAIDFYGSRKKLEDFISGGGNLVNFLTGEGTKDAGQTRGS